MASYDTEVQRHGCTISFLDSRPEPGYAASRRKGPWESLTQACAKQKMTGRSNDKTNPTTKSMKQVHVLSAKAVVKECFAPQRNLIRYKRAVILILIQEWRRFT